ncbi:cysteine methyltransferase, partial [Streptomyces venezuelae]
MNAMAQDQRAAVWAVVDSDIGPLLLAATDEGLVTVGFHATESVCEKTLDRLGSRRGAEPGHAPGTPQHAGPTAQRRAYLAGGRHDIELPR